MRSCATWRATCGRDAVEDVGMRIGCGGSADCMLDTLVMESIVGMLVMIGGSANCRLDTLEVVSVVGVLVRIGSAARPTACPTRP